MRKNERERIVKKMEELIRNGVSNSVIKNRLNVSYSMIVKLRRKIKEQRSFVVEPYNENFNSDRLKGKYDEHIRN